MDASPSLLMARCGHRMKVARLQGSPIAACARSEEPEFVRSIRQRSLLARRGLSSWSIIPCGHRHTLSFARHSVLSCVKVGVATRMLPTLLCPDSTLSML